MLACVWFCSACTSAFIVSLMRMAAHPVKNLSLCLNQLCGEGVVEEDALLGHLHEVWTIVEIPFFS